MANQGSRVIGERKVPRRAMRILGSLRLGDAALLHPRHHLRLRALFRRAPGREPGRGPGALGLRHRRGRSRHRRPARRCSAPSPTPSGARKPWIAGFGGLLVLGSLALWWVAPGRRRAIPIALVAFAVGTIGAEFATVFNNAMMPDLVAGSRLGEPVRHRLGGRLCRRPRQPADQPRLPRRRPGDRQDPPRPHARSRPRPGAVRGRPRLRTVHRASGILVFVAPMFLFTPDMPKADADSRRALRRRPCARGATLKGLRGYRNAARFLLANMIYTDGLIALFAFGGDLRRRHLRLVARSSSASSASCSRSRARSAPSSAGRLDDRIGPKRVVSSDAGRARAGESRHRVGRSRACPVSSSRRHRRSDGDGLFASLRTENGPISCSAP